MSRPVPSPSMNGMIGSFGTSRVSFAPIVMGWPDLGGEKDGMAIFRISRNADVVRTRNRLRRGASPADLTLGRAFRDRAREGGEPFGQKLEPTEPAIRHEDVMHEAVNRRERLLSSVPRREAVTDVLARRGDVRPEHRTALEGGQARVEERTERASPATVAAHSSTSFLESDQRGRA